MNKFFTFLFALLAFGGTIKAQSDDTDNKINGLFSIGTDNLAEIIKGDECFVVVNIDTHDMILRNSQFIITLPTGVNAAKDSNGTVDVMIGSDQPSSNRGVPYYEVSAVQNVNNPQEIHILIKNDKNSLPVVDGELMRLYVTINDDVSVGSVLNGGSMSNIMISNVDASVAYTQDDFPFTIKVGGGGIITYKDSENIEDFVPANNVNVNVQRAVRGGAWNTICLPFNMTNVQISQVFGSDTKVADFTGCETVKSGNKVIGIKVQFTQVSEMIAHHPYILKSANEFTENGFTVNGVNIVRMADSGTPQTGSDGNLFIGVYAPIANLGSIDNPVAFISSNKFYYATGNSSLKGFRGYFDFKDLKDYISGLSAASNLSFFVDGEEATSIDGVTTTTLPVEGVYDLQGRKVEIGDKGIDGLQKGIYIINGKKVTVK